MQDNVLLQIISPKITVNDVGGAIEKYYIPLLLKKCRNKKIVATCNMIEIRLPDIARLYGSFSVAAGFPIFFSTRNLISLKTSCKLEIENIIFLL